MNKTLMLCIAMAAVGFMGTVAILSSGEAANAKWHDGLRVHTDYETGCQYLSAMNGGITPRLDAYGSRLCVPVKEAAGEADE